MARYGAVYSTCRSILPCLRGSFPRGGLPYFRCLVCLFIDYLGYWYPMLQMLALVLTSVFFALVIGIPIGIWGSQQAGSKENHQSIIGSNADDARIRLFATGHLLLQYRGCSGSRSIRYLFDAANNPFDDAGNRASSERFNRSDRSIWFDNVAKIMQSPNSTRQTDNYGRCQSKHYALTYRWLLLRQWLVHQGLVKKYTGQ